MQRITTPSIQSYETLHFEEVRRAAPECMVLLKYDGKFPVSPCKLAAYGSGVRHTVKGGTGSGDVNVRSFTTVEKGLENAGFELTTGAWLDAYDIVLAKAKAEFARYLQKIMQENPSPLATFGLTMAEPEYDLPLCGAGDTAIYVLSRNSGEGADRKIVPGDILLTKTEIRDILSLSRKYERFMLVLNVGGLVDLTPVNEVKNILLLSQLGMPTGDALADVLCGKSYPSGHLAMTWAAIDAYPSAKGFGAQDDTLYREGVFVGYRYFDTFEAPCTYPFGYGLSYTTFACAATSFSADEKKVTVGVKVKNTGLNKGKEVVQLYYSAPEDTLSKPEKELAAFAKTRELLPGQEEEFTLSFAVADMSSYDTSRFAYVLAPGVYEILLGTCSGNVSACGKLCLDTEVVTRQLQKAVDAPEFEDLKPNHHKKPVDPTGAIHLDTEKFTCQTAVYPKEKEALPGMGGSWDDVKQGRISMNAFVSGLNENQLAWLCIGNYADPKEGQSPMEVIGNAAAHVAGAAGETTNRLMDKGVPALILPDGPAGLRLSSRYVLRDGSAVSLDPSIITGVAIEQEAGEQVYYQYCTAIPIGTALSQSWNPPLAKGLGSLVGEEMEKFHVHLWLAPAMNIQRNPLCGRNFEYYSEDPLLSGLIAGAITEGVQAHPGCATTVKHFCCNNQETNRMRSNSVLSERALREIYLKGFEICIKKAQPHCVMSSYNLINGQHVNNSRAILTRVLRDEWGFQGFVMTDWLTTLNMDATPHKYGISSAAGCIKAGNDMIMPGLPSDFEDILSALHDENHPYSLTRTQLQTSAKRILQVILTLAE